MQTIKIQLGEKTTEVERDGDVLSLLGRPCICGKCAKPLVDAGRYDSAQSGKRSYHPEVQLFLRGDVVMCSSCGERGRIIDTDREVQFVEHHDMETGITVYTLRDRLSAQAWKRVAHLFERDVELDCPSYNAWNDSVTLPWATGVPEQVKAILNPETVSAGATAPSAEAAPVAVTVTVPADEQPAQEGFIGDDSHTCRRQVIEGLVIATEGSTDWETCKTPGLEAAVSLIERDYDEREKQIFRAVQALTAPEAQAAFEENPFLFQGYSPEQDALETELRAQAKSEGYHRYCEGIISVLTTPKGQVTTITKTEAMHPVESYNLSRLRVRVELA